MRDKLPCPFGRPTMDRAGIIYITPYRRYNAMTMGQRIQQIRLELGLSQEEFGEKLGTTRQTVSRWELNQSYPELAKIVLISKLFSVTTDSILKDGISTFDTETEVFACGVYRSSNAEIVETEKYALKYYCSPDKSILGTKLYTGYESKKAWSRFASAIKRKI